MRATFAQQLADYFTAREGQWIDGRTLATVGGSYAWRSRLTDLRRQYRMQIDNRQRRVTSGGETFVISEYRLVPRDDFQLTA